MGAELAGVWVVGQGLATLFGVLASMTLTCQAASERSRRFVAAKTVAEQARREKHARYLAWEATLTPSQAN